MRAYAIPAGSILLALQARHNWRREIPEKIENRGIPREPAFIANEENSGHALLTNLHFNLPRSVPLLVFFTKNLLILSLDCNELLCTKYPFSLLDENKNIYVGTFLFRCLHYLHLQSCDSHFCRILESSILEI